MPIKSWFNSRKDVELKLYIEILKAMSVTNDLRDHLLRFVSNNQVDVAKADELFGITREKRKGFQSTKHRNSL